MYSYSYVKKKNNKNKLCLSLVCLTKMLCSPWLISRCPRPWGRWCTWWSQRWVGVDTHTQIAIYLQARQSHHRCAIPLDLSPSQFWVNHLSCFWHCWVSWSTIITKWLLYSFLSSLCFMWSVKNSTFSTRNNEAFSETSFSFLFLTAMGFINNICHLWVPKYTLQSKGNTSSLV